MLKNFTQMPRQGIRAMCLFGDEESVLVLEFETFLLADRHAELLRLGAQSDRPTYRPHVTVATELPSKPNLDEIVPFEGPLVLGGERWSSLTEDEVEIPGSQYVDRPVLNAVEVIDHFASQGVAGLSGASELHVTILYSMVKPNAEPDSIGLVVR